MAEHYCVKSLEPVSPNVASATAENQYRDEDDQKIGGVHIVLRGIIRDWIGHLPLLKFELNNRTSLASPSTRAARVRPTSRTAPIRWNCSPTTLPPS